MTAQPPIRTKAAKVVSARTNEFEPLVQIWMQKNPGVSTSYLVRQGLRMALRQYAGKRYAHLVEGVK